jgi:hypothetical protein
LQPVAEYKHGKNKEYDHHHITVANNIFEMDNEKLIEQQLSPKRRENIRMNFKKCIRKVMQMTSLKRGKTFYHHDSIITNSQNKVGKLAKVKLKTNQQDKVVHYNFTNKVISSNILSNLC